MAGAAGVAGAEGAGGACGPAASRSDLGPLTPERYAGYLRGATKRIDDFRAALDAEQSRQGGIDGQRFDDGAKSPVGPLGPTPPPAAAQVMAANVAKQTTTAPKVAPAPPGPQAAKEVAGHIDGMMKRMAGGGFPKADLDAGLAVLDSLDGRNFCTPRSSWRSTPG